MTYFPIWILFSKELRQTKNKLPDTNSSDDKNNGSKQNIKTTEETSCEQKYKRIFIPFFK